MSGRVLWRSSNWIFCSLTFNIWSCTFLLRLKTALHSAPIYFVCFLFLPLEGKPHEDETFIVRYCAMEAAPLQGEGWSAASHYGILSCILLNFSSCARHFFRTPGEIAQWSQGAQSSLPAAAPSVLCPQLHCPALMSCLRFSSADLLSHSNPDFPFLPFSLPPSFLFFPPITNV